MVTSHLCPGTGAPTSTATTTNSHYVLRHRDPGSRLHQCRQLRRHGLQRDGLGGRRLDRPVRGHRLVRRHRCVFSQRGRAAAPFPTGITRGRYRSAAARRRRPSAAPSATPSSRSPLFANHTSPSPSHENPGVNHDLTPDVWLPGFGAFFTALTYAVSGYEMKKTGVKMTSEHFNSAGRNVGAGASYDLHASWQTKPAPVSAGVFPPRGKPNAFAACPTD